MPTALIRRRVSGGIAVRGGLALLAAGALTATAWVATSGWPLGATAQAASAQSCTGVDTVADTFTYRVNGVTVLGLEDHVHSGDTVVAVFSVIPGCTIQVSLVSYTTPRASFSRDTAIAHRVSSSQTGVFSGGPHTLTATVPPCFFQIDFVTGPVLTSLGPANSHNFYGDQHRSIDSENGGTGPCIATPTPPATSTPTPTPTPTGDVQGIQTQPADSPPGSGTGLTAGVSAIPATGAGLSFGTGAFLIVIGACILLGLVRRRTTRR